MGEEKRIQENASGEVCHTGVEGLDDILGGGFPRNCLYLLQGDPGSGKTTLAFQFLLEGFRLGQPLQEFQGILTGTSVSYGNTQQILTPSDAVH